jgi:tRNA (guanine-N7-)-methyltransferase
MSEEASDVRTRPLRSYGRILGRALSPRQNSLIEQLLPRLAIPLGGPIEPSALFTTPKRAYWLEVGFGGAEHVLEQAKRHPDVGFLACEPFMEGVAKALTGIDALGLSNVRLLQGDARDLLQCLPASSLQRAFILFPDPWPKARHHKRRLINPSFLDSLARVLVPGASVRFATDWQDYADQALVTFLAHPAFSWTAQRADDWRIAPQDHVTTRYQEKKLGDINPLFFDFTRQPTG